MIGDHLVADAEQPGERRVWRCLSPSPGDRERLRDDVLGSGPVLDPPEGESAQLRVVGLDQGVELPLLSPRRAARVHQ